MTDRSVEARLRRFLLWTAFAAFAGAVVELVLVEHTGDTLQLLPFALAGIGIATIVVALVTERRPVLQALRLAMVLAALGGVFGSYTHLEQNIAFEAEIHPDHPAGARLWKSLGGANPLLAPGVLTLGAILAIGATYRHPALRR